MRTILPTEFFDKLAISSTGQRGKEARKLISKKCNGAINSLIVFLLFVLPLANSPYTVDYFNINKLILVLVTSFLGLLALIIGGLFGEGFKVRTLSTYVPFSVILLMVLTTWYGTMNREYTLFGRLGDYSYSGILMLGLVSLGLMSLSVKINVRKLFIGFLLGETLAILISVFAIFQDSLSSIFGRSVSIFPVVFNTVGSFEELLSIQLVAMLISFYLLLNSASMFGKKFFDSKAFFMIILLLNLTYFMISKNVLYLSLLLLGFVVITLLNIVKLKDSKGFIIGLVAFATVLLALVYIPAISGKLGINGVSQSNSYVKLPFRESWQIATSTLRDSALFGVGFGNYDKVFSLYRPVSLNFTPIWQVRFTHAYNDIFYVTATAGLVGIALYSIFWAWIVSGASRLSGKLKDEENVLLVVVYTALAVLFIGRINIIMGSLLFIAAGMVFRKSSKEIASVKAKTGLVVMMLLLTFLYGFGFIVLYRYYVSEIFFRKSLAAGDPVSRYRLQRAAIGNKPSETIYRIQNISTGMYLARSLSGIKDLTDDEKGQVLKLVEQSIRDSKDMVQVVDPLGVASWEVRGEIYNSLTGVAEKSDEFALKAYLKATKLENTNPRLWLKVGGIYYRNKNYQQALSAFANAARLKNDYSNAHYNLAHTLKELGYIQDAIIRLEVVARLVPVDSDDYKLVVKDIEALKKVLKQAQAAKQKSNVDAKVMNEVKKTGNVNVDDSIGTSSTEPLVNPVENPEETFDAIIVPDEIIEGEATE